MKKHALIIFAIMIFISSSLNGEGNNCESLKKEYEVKLSKFNDVKANMSKPDITKDQYDQLYADYTEIWEEASQLKKKVQECEQGAKSKHLAVFNEGIALKKDKKYAEALAKFMEVTKIKSDFQKVNYQIADVLIYLGRDGEVDKWLSLVNDADEKGKLLYKRASSVKNSKPSTAVKYYKDMAAYYKPAKAYYLAGIVYLNKLYNKHKALEYFKKALKHTPEDPKLHDAIGATIMELKPPKGKTKKDLTIEAITYFKNGIKYGEGYKSFDLLCVRLAQAYNSIDQHKTAIKYADMAIKSTKKKNLASANLEKGIALCKLGQCNDAKKYLNLAEKDMTTKSQAIFWLDKTDEGSK
ncbi:MAG: hypothetical protein PF638_01095 [Candidatus Delongbacteria bacterium]|jgi:tetratricopeptide (TPR) repeat protein|nr:hypothetical protein [Candidatus Delongbacteria bacterium]